MDIHDETKIPELLKVLEELSTTHVEVGIMGDSGIGASSYMDMSTGNTITVLAIAEIHEFGLNMTDKNGNKINIPERSFIRGSYDANKQKLFNLENELEKVLSLNLSVNTFFNLVGEYSVGIIQEYLTNLKNPPLAESTIKTKGSSNPLIDTGRLRDAITFKIVRM